MSRRNPLRLLVEGDEDKRVIPNLVEANGVAWSDTAADAIVLIEAFDGVERLLAPGVIETELKQSGLRALGILIDANGDCENRWNRVRTRCTQAFSDLPSVLPREGLVATNVDGLRLGVWIMPDNHSSGMIETFLSHLITSPTESAVLELAKQAMDDARDAGASWKDAHEAKALIHTWLAWQDPPGQQLHLALLQRILNPLSPKSKDFIDWFRKLYQV